ncbi:hypothetical protein FB45DRAFT_748138 [Roridomyces roridus]|uniref:Defect at low temperature protein 1 n=1 Tax=Roridomyces roridus TaxID=1738132 RepID=A0AAD7BU35_9AGAR|nr:hypothetical protein FB45DRAFT_748138 [Roridomyces roridus]
MFRRQLRLLLRVSYVFLVLLTIIFTGLSCVALLAQAVRHSPNRTWAHNYNALVIGVSYVAVLVFSLIFCVNRRLAVRTRLQRISKAHTIIRRGDVPNAVHNYITQEYMRTCLISYESLPTDVYHPGWGRPGTIYEGVRFRRALLDTIAQIDALAHAVIPTHPALKPHVRMLHHFRFILPLLNSEDEEFTPLHYYDSAIQLARNAAVEPTEEEFIIGIQAADEIKKRCVICCCEAYI